jgi:hypothetical protein
VPISWLNVCRTDEKKVCRLALNDDNIKRLYRVNAAGTVSAARPEPFRRFPGYKKQTNPGEIITTSNSEPVHKTQSNLENSEDAIKPIFI